LETISIGKEFIFQMNWFMSVVMGVGSWGQGEAMATLDFHTWYKYSRYRLNSAVFWSLLLFFGRLFFLLFSVFIPLPPLEIFLPTPLSVIYVSCFTKVL